MANYLKKEELEAGKAYEVTARNFSIAIWTGEDFVGLRYKFGDRFLDHEMHWDDHVRHGTVRPLRKLV